MGFQVYEYAHAYSELGLTLGAGVYGATFFILTGFHGMHVTLGAIMLMVMLFRSGHEGPFLRAQPLCLRGITWLGTGTLWTWSG
jgi:cytochrome c oxidase subunit 3